MIPTPLSTSGHREYQLFPYYAAVDHFITRPSKEIPTLLMSHKSTPGDTNTPVNTAERLTLVQRQPYRLCRTYPLFSSRLTLHIEEFLSSRLQQMSFNDRSVIFMLKHIFTDLYHTTTTSLLHRFICAPKASLSQVFNVHP